MLGCIAVGQLRAIMPHHRLQPPDGLRILEGIAMIRSVMWPTQRQHIPSIDCGVQVNESRRCWTHSASQNEGAGDNSWLVDR
jgi:hypothetical protein